MFTLITNLPALSLFVLISLGMILVSILIVFCVHRYNLVKPNYQDDPILGNVGTLIGTIYGVLAGLTALYLVNNIAFTTDAVQREANAIADIYRDTKWLKEPQQAVIQAEIKKYITNVVDVEWPMMKAGKRVDSNGYLIIDEITASLIAYKTITNAESLLVHDMLDEIRILYDARHQRIHMSNIELNPEIWFVVLIGTILTMGINFLFRMQFNLHVIVVAATALMASAVIFLLISLDRPFQGNFVVEPEALQNVLDIINLRQKQEAAKKLDEKPNSMTPEQKIIEQTN